jgi:hypothetical protein
MASDSIAARLEELKREVQRAWRPPARVRAARRRQARRRPLAMQIALGVLKVAAIVALPFLAYVRSSVFFYSRGDAPWLSVIGGVALATCIIAGYATWLARRLSGQARLAQVARWVALPIVAAWCVYTLVYLARVNAKTDEVRGYYRSVHPVMRVALSTAILFDPGVVITDMRRVREDYARMGLPVYDATKHYKQPDGWVHAVDLRTIGHGEARNRTLELYFRAMGFSTKRHVGTADHLHVQLRRRE